MWSHACGKKRLLVEKQPKGSNRSASQTSAMSRVAWRVLTVKNFLTQLADVQRGEECEECSGLKSNIAPLPWRGARPIARWHLKVSHTFFKSEFVKCVFCFVFDNWVALFMQTRRAKMWEQDRSHLYQALSLTNRVQHKSCFYSFKKNWKKIHTLEAAERAELVIKIMTILWPVVTCWYCGKVVDQTLDFCSSCSITKLK